MAEFTLPVPQDWHRAEPFYEGALHRALTVLRDPRTPERLTRYYQRGGSFAGSTFIRLSDNAPTTITERDLLAVSMLDVSMSPGLVRGVLEDESVIARVSELLGQLPPEARLEEATPELVLVMDELYRTVRDLTPQSRDRYPVQWVSAAKLCARKRPNLFPVRDEIVCRYLGTWPSRYQIDWQVFARIIGDGEVQERLQRIVDRAMESPSVDIADRRNLLRHLDVCLWMHAPHHQP